jgi:hypothetical protein
MTKLTRNPPSRTRRLLRKAVIPVAVALIAAVGGIAEAQVTSHGSGPSPSATAPRVTKNTAPRVTFTSPQAGTTITTWPSADRVEGVLHGALPKGWGIYFAVRPAGSDKRYPASAACDVQDGKVLCAEVYLGKKIQPPQTFYLEFWVADPQALAVLQARPVDADTPLPRPTGASLTDEVRVERH